MAPAPKGLDVWGTQEGGLYPPNADGKLRPRAVHRQGRPGRGSCKHTPLSRGASQPPCGPQGHPSASQLEEGQRAPGREPKSEAHAGSSRERDRSLQILRELTRQTRPEPGPPAQRCSEVLCERLLRGSLEAVTGTQPGPAAQCELKSGPAGGLSEPKLSQRELERILASPFGLGRIQCEHRSFQNAHPFPGEQGQ